MNPIDATGADARFFHNRGTKSMTHARGERRQSQRETQVHLGTWCSGHRMMFKKYCS
jgi:hypothetical protein